MRIRGEKPDVDLGFWYFSNRWSRGERSELFLWSELELSKAGKVLIAPHPFLPIWKADHQDISVARISFGHHFEGRGGWVEVMRDQRTLSYAHYIDINLNDDLIRVGANLIPLSGSYLFRARFQAPS